MHIALVAAVERNVVVADACGRPVVLRKNFSKYEQGTVTNDDQVPDYLPRLTN